MNTDNLIESLAKNLAPIEPLWRPGMRAAAWLLGAALYVWALTLSMTSGPDIAASGTDTRLLLPQLVAIATSILAVTAAFGSVVPGYSKHVFVWPLIATLAWLGTLIVGSLQQWRGPATILAAQSEWLCVGLIVLGGAPLVAVLAAMLRRGAPLRPAVTAALAAIAVGTLANVGACVSHSHTNNDVTLVWHGGAILALVLLCAWGGRFVLTWSTAQRASPLRG
jgi:hypothetical protein